MAMGGPLGSTTATRRDETAVLDGGVTLNDFITLGADPQGDGHPLPL